MKNYLPIGQFKKPFGVKGLMRVVIEDAYWDSFMDIEVLFVKERGHMVPYFVEQIEDSNQLLIKLEDVDSPEVAKVLSNQPVYVPDDVIEMDEPVISEALVGFKVIDMEQGVLGELLSLEEYPQQIMAVVAYQQKEILIPLHESLIDRIDPDKKELYMNLPEGLLEL